MSGVVLDLILVALIVAFAINGYRQGFVVGLLSFVGFFGGAAIGLQIGPVLASLSQTGGVRALIALVVVFGLAIAGQAGASWIGNRVRDGISWRSLRRLDNVGGAVVSAGALILVVWLVAAPLASSSVPSLARAVRTSSILHGINDVMPGQAQALSDSLRQTLDSRGFPDVFAGLDPTQIRQVSPPDPGLADSAVVNKTETSVVKVLGTAPSCSRRIEGSGFIFAPGHVLTNAHVVAGTHSITVLRDGVRHRAQVVLYDPERDLAVIYVPDITGPVLNFAAAPEGTGDDAIVLGYPLDGPYDAQSARVRDVGAIRGPDIYDSTTVTRDIYTVRGLVRSGNSGGPLMAPSGTVLGVVFAAAADDPDTGFALSAKEAAPDASAGRTATAPAGTGACTDD